VPTEPPGYFACIRGQSFAQFWRAAHALDRIGQRGRVSGIEKADRIILEVVLDRAQAGSDDRMPSARSSRSSTVAGIHSGAAALTRSAMYCL
jgi:hypothetical protein